MRSSSLLLALGLILSGVPGLARPLVLQADWPLAYLGKSTNEFALDARLKTLVETRVPAALSDNVLAALGGPPDPVSIVQGRYVSASACRPHSCDEKGFLWIDTTTGIGLGAYEVSGALLLGSNGMSARAIPPSARAALIAWLRENDIAIASAAFVDGAGARSALDAGAFRSPAPFQPAPGGPAFDCRLASDRIEQAICHDAALSAKDLALGRLYKEIRRGSATTVARDQLQALQRGWLKERNSECAGADTVSCLAGQYDAQYQRLENWVPGVAK